MRTYNDAHLVKSGFKTYSDIYLTPAVIKGSILHCYETLDMIDQNLVGKGVSKLSGLVELANLSSIIGNLLGAGFAEHSNGHYYRNKPHTYPDLVSSDVSKPGIEIKTALKKNSPKGHQPKPGYYLTYRYCLTDSNGNADADPVLLDTVTIWEVKFGYLKQSDFSCSNTEGDSGKTAVIKTASFHDMSLLYFNPNCNPYKRYKGFN